MDEKPVRDNNLKDEYIKSKLENKIIKSKFVNMLVKSKFVNILVKSRLIQNIPVTLGTALLLIGLAAGVTACAVRNGGSDGNVTAESTVDGAAESAVDGAAESTVDGAADGVFSSCDESGDSTAEGASDNSGNGDSDIGIENISESADIVGDSKTGANSGADKTEASRELTSVPKPVYDPAAGIKMQVYPEYLRILEDYETAIRKILMVEFTPFKATQTALADVTGDGVPELFFVSQRSDAYNPHFLSVDLHVYGIRKEGGTYSAQEIYSYPRLYRETVDDTLQYSLFTAKNTDGFYLCIRTGSEVYHENWYHIADDGAGMSAHSVSAEDIAKAGGVDRVLMGQLNLAEYGFSGYHIITRSYDDLTGYLENEIKRLNSEEVRREKLRAEEIIKKWKYYYKAILRTLNITKKMKTNAPQTGSVYSSFRGYQMGDLDGDGIPELIIDMYAQNVKSAGCFVFSYKEGKKVSDTLDVSEEIEAYMIHDVRLNVIFRSPETGKGLIYDDIDFYNEKTHEVRVTLSNGELNYEELNEYPDGKGASEKTENSGTIEVFEINNLNGIDEYGSVK